MNDLTLIKHNGGVYIDSREIAESIGERHDSLLREIERYREIMAHRFEESDFFIESSYTDAQNKEMPCYLVSRTGCDLIAHRLTGEQGILFTCAYSLKFNEAEQVARFLKESNELRGFGTGLCPRSRTAPRWRNANGIAKECGMYSLSGKPHGQAAASILKEILCVGAEHKRIETDHFGIITLYDDCALHSVMRWLAENGLPQRIKGNSRSYRVQYI